MCACNNGPKQVFTSAQAQADAAAAEAKRIEADRLANSKSLANASANASSR